MFSSGSNYSLIVITSLLALGVIPESDKAELRWVSDTLRRLGEVHGIEFGLQGSRLPWEKWPSPSPEPQTASGAAAASRAAAREQCSSEYDDGTSRSTSLSADSSFGGPSPRPSAVKNATVVTQQEVPLEVKLQALYMTAPAVSSPQPLMVSIEDDEL